MKADGKTIVRIVVGLLCVAYLLNFGAGIIELLPDNVPLVGHLDEVAATVLAEQLLFFGLPSSIVKTLFQLKKK